ncbi:MAG: hypothetical protein OIF40_12020 [Mangrovicoccus sp.]|nr:hypothetical protein [Mangrovicoccus sp.]
MDQSNLDETSISSLTTPANVIDPSCVASASHPLLLLRMDEDLTVLDAQGQTIYLTQKKGRLMLAMLGSGKDMRRSRDWLRSHLWGRSFTSHGYSSLRQCLHNMRRALGSACVCLQANREFIWLEHTAVDWTPAEKDPSYFLAGLTQLDHSARQWLLQERAKLRENETPAQRDAVGAARQLMSDAVR